MVDKPVPPRHPTTPQPPFAPPPAAPPMGRAPHTGTTGPTGPARHAVEKKVEEKKGAYPSEWRAGIDGPIVAPLITAGTYNVQQYVGIQFPLASVLLTTTGVSVVNTDPTYTTWLGVPNTLGPIQSVARPAGS